MTHDPDQRIADLLRADAPAERDPLFRVAVLHRLEREKYRRQIVSLIACGAVLAALAVGGAAVGGAARETVIALLVAGALAAVYFVVAPTLTQLLARFR